MSRQRPPLTGADRDRALALRRRLSSGVALGGATAMAGLGLLAHATHAGTATAATTTAPAAASTPASSAAATAPSSMSSGSVSASSSATPAAVTGGS